MKTIKFLLSLSLAANFVLGWLFWKKRTELPMMLAKPDDLHEKIPLLAPTLDAAETPGAMMLLGRSLELEQAKARTEDARRHLERAIGKARQVRVDEDESIEFRNAEFRPRRYDYQTPPRIPWDKWDVYGVDRGLYVTPKDAGF